MLERLFTSKTRLKILTLLMFSQKEYHLRDIARQIGISPTYVSKELANLKKINLVIESKKGNLNLYKINKDCVIFEDLRQLFIKTDFLGQLIRDELHGKVKYAFIFGSFAQGEEKEKSDIDLFVVGDINEDTLIRIIQKLEVKIKREINYVLWTEAVFNKRANHHLLKSIKNKKILMLVGDENELRKR